ncbi:hypothetical protein JQ615_37785 [Bradyrhizobium jicamae]|uniref:Uncharacterized protein n=1 Tax=Bradyrhizobium jicamae TaxID=280332 RepID=A0ABS5FWB0_9BRAD|nr:hypothetical protein [Bradyrhizobium jicamae]MBR0801126.1 hypothetical protein [Bradyrhizobium jicamae]
MRRAIDTAPRDGQFVILEDDVSGVFELARWSAQAHSWVRENGEPSEITPTHWQTAHLPQEGDEFLQDEPVRQEEAGLNTPSPSRGPRSFVFPSGLAERARVMQLTRLAPNTDLSLSELGVRAPQGKSESRPRAPRWFAVSSIATGMVAASLVGLYFHTELASYVTRYVGEQDNVRTATAGVEFVKQETPIPSQDSQKAASLAPDPALHQQAGRAISKALQDTAQGKQGAEAMQPKAQQSMEEERRRAEVLANELARAQQAIEMQVARANKARDQAMQLSQAAENGMAELRQSLQKEHDRAEALAGELAKARRDIDTLLALPSKAQDRAAQANQGAEKATASQRQSLRTDHDRAEAPGREPTQPTIGARIEVERTSNGQIAQVTQAAKTVTTEQPAVAAAQGSPETARLLARASALLGQGNIGAARIVLERAVETGSAQASFMLAETYDPLVLSKWKTYGTRGDVTKARELYAKALSGGVQEARDRSVALQY